MEVTATTNNDEYAKSGKKREKNLNPWPISLLMIGEKCLRCSVGRIRWIFLCNFLANHLVATLASEQVLAI